MTVLIPNGFAQVTLQLQHISGSHVGAIVFGVQFDDPISEGSDLADKMVLDYDETIGVRTDAGVVIGPAIVRVGAASGDPVSFVGTETAEGAITGDVEPSSVAILVKKVTLTGGRRGRGRVFFPWCLPHDKVDDVGVIDPSYKATFQGACDDWMVLLSSARGGVQATPMVLLHDDEGESAAPAPSAVTGLVVQSLIGTQRRRLGR